MKWILLSSSSSSSNSVYASLLVLNITTSNITPWNFTHMLLDAQARLWTRSQQVEAGEVGGRGLGVDWFNQEGKRIGLMVKDYFRCSTHSPAQKYHWYRRAAVTQILKWQDAYHPWCFKKTSQGLQMCQVVIATYHNFLQFVTAFVCICFFIKV